LNYYAVNDRLYLVDLPGYGYARASREERRVWAAFVEPYLETRKALKGVVQLVDCRHDPTELDTQMLEWLQHRQKRFLVALTKADKVSRSGLQARVEQMSSLLGAAESITVVPFSTKTKAGRREIWQWVDEVIA
jgi:GTP-binding protein